MACKATSVSPPTPDPGVGGGSGPVCTPPTCAGATDACGQYPGSAMDSCIDGIKGYTAVYAVKYVTEKKLGKFDRKGFAKTMHGLTITPQDEPAILIETTWDNDGEIDRISFLAEVVGGQQKITKILPKLGK